MGISCVQCDSVVAGDYAYNPDTNYYSNYEGLDHYSFTCCPTSEAFSIQPGKLILISSLMVFLILVSLFRRQLAKVSF